LLNVLDRPGDGCAALRHLLTDNHDARPAQRRHIRQAIAIYRALLASGVVERLDQPDRDGRLVRVNLDLQADFALNQPLAPFAMASVALLDRESDDYRLDLVSVVEAVLDNPGVVLAAQVNRAKTELMAEMKAAGVEYEERIARLAEVRHPMPLAPLLDAAFDIYRQTNPWVADHQVRPKSVVRDMWERAMTFTEYVAHYGIGRSEGVLLRYLSDAYRTLVRTVPEDAKTAEFDEITLWLGELVRQVDSSLLDEWEALTAPQPEPVPVHKADVPPPVTANVRAFTVLVRNELFRRVELAALRRYGDLGELDAAAGWDAARWRLALDAYFADHDSIGTGGAARGPSMFVASTGQDPDAPAARRWQVRQVLDDPDGDHEWGISAEIDLDASDEAGEAVLRLLDVGRL
jgi:hypothetical protein